MKTPKKPNQNTPGSLQESRITALQSMQHTLIQEHQIACGYLHHLSTQPDIAELAPTEQRQLIQTGLEKYATTAQKMLSILEKLTDHEQALSSFSAEETPEEATEPAPSDLQWDMLIRHAQRSVKQPLLPRIPLPKNSIHKDISNP